MMGSERDRISIRQMTVEDIPGVLELQRRTFSGMATWTAEQLEQHLKVFPEGQLVAVDEDGHIVGSSSSLIIDWDDYAKEADWSTITAKGTFATHDPRGKTLYGADMSVDPRYRRLGIGSRFYEERKKLVRERNLKRLLTGGRIPGYSQVAHELTPTEYVAEVARGKRTDPTLSFQLANGFAVLDVVPDYLHDDAASLSYATLLEWLNPEYLSTVSLETSELRETPVPGVVERAGRAATRRVRIAAVQYELRSIGSFEDFARQVELFVRTAHEYHCHFVLFPEFFTMQLLSYLHDPAPGRAVRRLAELTPRYEALFRRLAIETRLYIIAGTHPIIQEGRLCNAAHLFTPRGRVFRQKKVHLTHTEKGSFQMDRGHGFYTYDTDYGRIGILVCYDVEFPEAARVLAEAGAEILFVPSCTDDRQGYFRVRYCAQSRAIENQLYVAIASTVGNLANVPQMAAHYGQAAVLTPSDYHFARDGIAAEGILNQEQMIVCDVDLDLLEEQRISGTVIPLEDRIEDAYDRVLRCSDLPEQVPEADVTGSRQSTRRAASSTEHTGAEAGRAGV
jgi:predicted amidohydrolase/predicted N-acetyltransferase YhbS